MILDEAYVKPVAPQVVDQVRGVPGRPLEGDNSEVRPAPRCPTAWRYPLIPPAKICSFLELGASFLSRLGVERDSQLRQCAPSAASASKRDLMSQPVMPTTDAIPGPDTARCPQRRCLCCDRYLHGARDVDAHLRASLGRGPQPSAHAGCQPGKVASGAHDVVLRDFSAFAVHALTIVPSIPPSAISSIRITTRLAIGLCEPCGIFCRVPVWTRCMPTAFTWTKRWLDLLTQELPAGSACDLVELGINHEQQHQELIVTDVKNGLWTQSAAACLSMPR